ELRIRRVWRPGVVLPHALGASLRTLRPRLRAELARLRNQVELPELTAGMDVESADSARHVVLANRKVSVNRRVADDDDVVDDDRGRAVGDLPAGGIDPDGAVRADLANGVPLFTRPCLTRRRRVADDERT